MNCKVCGDPINPKRLEILPQTKTCLKHSEVGKKVGVPVSLGQGDHTYTELNIMEAEDYKKFEKQYTTRPSHYDFGG